MTPKQVFTLVSMLSIILTLVVAGGLFFRGSSINVSAVETFGKIGVYWDKACTQKVTAVDWGNLYVGSSKEVAVYVRNEGNESNYILVSTANWNPANAFLYLFFSWSCDKKRLTLAK